MFNIDKMHGFTEENQLIDYVDNKVGKEEIEYLADNLLDILEFEEDRERGVTDSSIEGFYSKAIKRCSTVRVLFETVIPDLLHIDSNITDKIIDYLLSLAETGIVEEESNHGRVKVATISCKVPEHVKDLARTASSEEDVRRELMYFNSSIIENATEMWRRIPGHLSTRSA